MPIGKITLWILASVGVLDLFEVAIALQRGWIYGTP